jgi:hypothetical protein
VTSAFGGQGFKHSHDIQRPLSLSEPLALQ